MKSVKFLSVLLILILALSACGKEQVKKDTSTKLPNLVPKENTAKVLDNRISLKEGSKVELVHVEKLQTKAKHANEMVVSKRGNTYYYDANGKRVKNQFVVDKKGRRYYFGDNGKMVKGWQKIGGEYFFFKKKNGKMLTNIKIDGIKINWLGTIKKTKYNVNKINTIFKAEKVVKKITKKTDTKEQKLKKCFDWIMSFPYKRYRKVSDTGYKKGWEITFANDIFDHEAGCCVSESAAFAFLARECGYTDVYVCNDTSHGWTEINGYVYDPLFAEARGVSGYYKITYEKYNLWPAGGKVLV